VRFIELIRNLPPKLVLGAVASHGMLLAAVLQGGLPYPALGLLLVLELLLINVVTLVIYRPEGLGRHLIKLLQGTGVMLFLLAWQLVAYGIATEQAKGDALAAVLRGFAKTDILALRWALIYLAVHLAMTLWQTMRSAEPRLAWAQSAQRDGGATLAAMAVMIFLALLVSFPLKAFDGVNADALLASLMVATQLVMSLILLTVSDRELEEVTARSFET
jgi:hypothetical protein